MFIAKYNEKIVQLADTLEELKSKLTFVVYDTIEETNIEYEMVNGQILTPEEKEDEKNARIAMLHVTRLDFINILEELGLTWSNMKAIMAQYPEVEKELTMCSNVYRGNPLIDNMIPMVNQAFGLNITTVDLDNAFKNKVGLNDLE